MKDNLPTEDPVNDDLLIKAMTIFTEHGISVTDAKGDLLRGSIHQFVKFVTENYRPIVPAPSLDELRMEARKRIWIAMIHARNTKDEPSMLPMLEDTVNIVLSDFTNYLERTQKHE